MLNRSHRVAPSRGRDLRLIGKRVGGFLRVVLKTQVQSVQGWAVARGFDGFSFMFHSSRAGVVELPH